jgi:hypothetical protein
MEKAHLNFNIERLPKGLQATFRDLYSSQTTEKQQEYLSVNEIHHGDARDFLPQIEPNSIALSVWSPPYYVGKEYEAYLTFEGWQNLLKSVI